MLGFAPAMLADATGEPFHGEKPHPARETFPPAMRAAGVIDPRAAGALHAGHLGFAHCPVVPLSAARASA